MIICYWQLSHEERTNTEKVTEENRAICRTVRTYDTWATSENLWYRSQLDPFSPIQHHLMETTWSILLYVSQPRKQGSLSPKIQVKVIFQKAQTIIVPYGFSSRSQKLHSRQVQPGRLGGGKPEDERTQMPLLHHVFRGRSSYQEIQVQEDCACHSHP